MFCHTNKINEMLSLPILIPFIAFIFLFLLLYLNCDPSHRKNKVIPCPVRCSRPLSGNLLLTTEDLLLPTGLCCTAAKVDHLDFISLFYLIAKYILPFVPFGSVLIRCRKTR